MSIKTKGDWIQVKRMEKNLSPYYLAAKMGIARALILEWESDASQPDERQWKQLNKILA